MILRIQDWILDVDVSQNMEISSAQAQEHCTCGYCRNFYMGIDRAYPSVRLFLQQFGIDIFGPDELCPFEPTIYEVSYIVNGTILQAGKDPLRIDDIPVLITQECDMDTMREGPFFVLTIGLFALDWSLNEPMDEVVSPANEPECLDRMWRKLLNRVQGHEFTS